MSLHLYILIVLYFVQIAAVVLGTAEKTVAENAVESGEEHALAHEAALRLVANIIDLPDNAMSDTIKKSIIYMS